MATTNPLQFIQQVRTEVAKVVWPTKREVMLTTVMVFILAALTAVFFAIVDILIRGGLQRLSIARSGEFIFTPLKPASARAIAQT